MRILPAFLSLVVAAPVWAQTQVTDDTGRTVLLPEDPTRIVVLHEPLLGLPLMDLGVQVLGAYGRGDDGEMLMAVDFADAVLGERNQTPAPKGIGPVGNLSLERLRALEPDLIVGSEYDAAQADTLARIAPVYLQDIGSGRVRGIETQEDLASLLGREDDFAERQRAYADQVAETAASLQGQLPGTTYLAVIIHDQINLVGTTSGLVQALEDLGLERAEFEGGATNAPGSNFAAPINAEVFMQLDPSLLILMNSYMDAEQGEAAVRARLDRIAPGWDRFMGPARDGRIVYMDSAAVTSPTLASAGHTLDGIDDWIEQRAP